MVTPVNSQLESVMLSVIVQLILVIAAARLVGWLFRRYLGQPQVCGEIAAGLLLGPSFLGGGFPSIFHAVFPPEIGSVFSVLSQLGLILLMFLIGLEFDFGHLPSNGRAAISISLAGILLPFGLGVSVALLLHEKLGLETSRMGFCLFVGVALSITAIPILGRMMVEFNIHRTRLGCLTIAAAAIDDATGWILLAVVSAVVRAQLELWGVLEIVLGTVVYGLVMVFLVRPAFRRWGGQLVGSEGELSLGALAGILIFVFASAAATNKIGIFSIFGGFLAGAILHDQEELRRAIFGRMRDFVTVFFLPIFFTYTGLRTDIGVMQGAELWALCGLVLLAAFVGKFGGCATAARLSGCSAREASLVGIMMNTRALMELIVINLGYDLGIIPESVFFMLVFMAVVTTYITAPVARRLISRTELEPLFAVSPFAKARSAEKW